MTPQTKLEAEVAHLEKEVRRAMYRRKADCDCSTCKAHECLDRLAEIARSPR